MTTIFKRPAARRDLIEHYVYLAENAGIETADRFLARTEETLAALLAQPRMGAPLDSRHPEVANLRKWRVTDFENVLIFYLPHSRGISVVRVLYGARDWWELLGLG